MKNRSIPQSLVTAILVSTGLLAAGKASAAGHIPRQVDTIVQSVDRDTRTMVLNHAAATAPNTMVWTKDTRFVRNDVSVTSSDLAAGTKANVRYRQPFFGKPFATHIAWRSEAAK